MITSRWVKIIGDPQKQLYIQNLISMRLQCTEQKLELRNREERESWLVQNYKEWILFYLTFLLPLRKDIIGQRDNIFSHNRVELSTQSQTSPLFSFSHILLCYLYPSIYKTTRHLKTHGNSKFQKQLQALKTLINNGTTPTWFSFLPNWRRARFLLPTQQAWREETWCATSYPSHQHLWHRALAPPKYISLPQTNSTFILTQLCML